MTTTHNNTNKMFSNDLAFLSNMYPCEIQLIIDETSHTFQSAEAAFQAGKCQQSNGIPIFTALYNSYQAKTLGRKVQMRPDWNAYRIAWMEHVCRAKFAQNSDLCQRLIDTYPLELIETNTWGDRFWGVYKGKGTNHLGLILMNIRDEYRKEV